MSSPAPAEPVAHAPATESVSAPLAHEPYVPAGTTMTELTVRGLALGAVLGIVFAASSVYLALKVGLTVSASIPIAVLSITIFRAFGRATILENNIVQTTGSAGESIAAGVAFTLPAFLLMGYDLEASRVLVISVLGGVLGVLMMIPLRHGLIVEEHGKLAYPEGTACADVLIVGETGGTNARTVFTGFGIGFVYKLLGEGLKLFSMEPGRVLRFFKGGSIAAEVSPELLGVGYIIGLRVAATMMAGGIFSYLILNPMIAFFGGDLSQPLFPGSKLIANMSPHEMRNAYVLYIGAGAVATGGVVSLARAVPTIVSAFRAGFRNLRAGRSTAEAASVPRTARDLPMSVVAWGSLGLMIAIWAAPMLKLNAASAVLIVLFGFFFVTVSSRITGEIGSSSNPISGMTVATLLVTCLLFLAVGWTGVSYRAMALSTAAIVCIAASNGGTTSQDLKTGFLVGATPRNQQIALVVGVVTSAVVIGSTLLFLNKSYTTTVAEEWPGQTVSAVSDETRQGPDGKTYRVGYVTDSGGAIPQGTYLVDDASHVAFVVDPGIAGRAPSVPVEVQGGPKAPATAERLGHSLGPDRASYDLVEVKDAASGLEPGRYLAAADGTLRYRLKDVAKLDAPKARLFSLIIDGILTQKLPWALVLVGVFLAVGMELCGVSSLPFAVGVYLPISTSVPVFVGGIIRWLVDRKRGASGGEEESSPGTLLSSGYIAGGAIAGLLTAAEQGFGLDESLDLSKKLGAIAESSMSGVVWFSALALALYWFGRRGRGATAT